MIDAMPAKQLKEMLPELLPTFLPAGLRGRFSRACGSVRGRTPPEWDSVFESRRDELVDLLAEAGTWLDIEDWEILLLGYDDDLLLLYVMKVQTAALCILELPDTAYVPGQFEETWRWMTKLHPEETWMNWFRPIPMDCQSWLWSYDC